MAPFPARIQGQERQLKFQVKGDDLQTMHDFKSTEMVGVPPRDRGPADAGFTLIELMVVLLIIAILLAIAIPTFLGVTGSANDRAAQSNLTNALTELKALYQNGQTYCAVANCAAGVTALPLTGAGSVQSSAPEFTWTTGANVTAWEQHQHRARRRVECWRLVPA